MFSFKRVKRTEKQRLLKIATGFRRNGFLIPDREGDGSRTNPLREKVASGSLDEIKTGTCHRRLEVAELLQALFPTFGSCGRCKIPWALVSPHITRYSPHAGVFALCEQCWSELMVPGLRLPYYREVFNDWKRDDKGLQEKEWSCIESAIFCENIPAEIRARSMQSIN
jgi:hypothetical protein